MTEKIIKALDVEIKADADSHAFTAAISTNAVDRDGEVLIPQGMDATEFTKNPVVFYNHNYDRPIAKQVGKFKRGNNEIVATAEFAKRPDDFEGAWFPDEIRGLVNAGVVKGVSVGFQEQEGGTREATKADIENYGDGVRRVFNAWKLLEWSVAPLQSNPNALIQASHKGVISPERCQELFGVTVPEAKTQVAVVVPIAKATKRLTCYAVVLRKRRPQRRRRSVGIQRAEVSKTLTTALRKRLGRLYE